MKFTMTAALAAAFLSTSISAVVLPRGGGEGGDPPKNFIPITPATTARVATESYKLPFSPEASKRAEKEIICDEGGCHTRGVPQSFPPIPKPTKTAIVATGPYVPPFATKVPRANGEIICDEGGCHTRGVPQSFPPIPRPTKTASVATEPYVPPFATRVPRVDDASVINPSKPPSPTEFFKERREEGGDPPKHFTVIKPVTTARQGGPYVPPNSSNKGAS